MYIYQIENLINHKKYIGSTNNPKRRKKEHFMSAKNKNLQSYNYPLQKAIRKYGEDNFCFSVIEECSTEETSEREKYYIIKMNSLTNVGYGYNQTLETDCALRDEAIINQNICKNGKRCALVDDKEQIIKIFASYHQAARETYGGKEASPVRQVCNGNLRSMNGFVFRNINEDGEVVVPIFKTNKRKKAVFGIKVNDPEDIVFYDSVSEAARKEGINRGSIGKCISGSGKYSQVGGRIWREQGYELTTYEWNNIVMRRK